jgi:uncharacterized protein (TIGR00297 family)
MFTFAPNDNEWIVILLLLTGMFLSVKLKKLTLGGALTGGLTGFVIFLGAGYLGIVLLGFFFISGTLVTSHQAVLKNENAKIVQEENQRTAGQVFANSGCAALAALLAYVDETNSTLYIVMMTASLAPATSDTFSSELGTVYGKKFYNCLSFKADMKGENGVISLEGTLFGLIGAAFIAIIYFIFKGCFYHVFLIITAGLAGNFSDSVLGATLERKHYITNNVVNFISSAIAAWIVLLLV